MAVQRVEELLRKVTLALNVAGVEYAVIGGNAVAAWVSTVDPDAVRATKDVDLLVRRSDLGRIRDVLVPLGLVMIEVLGVWMFVDRDHPTPQGGVHLVFAGELIRPHDAHAAPDVSQSRPSALGYMVLDLAALVAMKLLANRNIDRAHIDDLIRIGLIDDALAETLPDDLRARLEEIRQSAR